MSDDLIAAHRDEPKLMPYLHLPFQAGADRILAAMNRKHTRAEYLALVERIRAARPDIALSTDVIVGFPGETEAEFEATLDVLERGGLRPGLHLQVQPAARHAGSAAWSSCPTRLRTARLQRVLERSSTNSQTAFNSGCVGRVMPVLFERPGRRPGQLVGRSPYMQAVHAERRGVILRSRRCRLKSSAAGPNSLSGQAEHAARLRQASADCARLRIWDSEICTAFGRLPN